jgi:site-specific DNA-methyltransferase (adenine-specific)
MSAAQSYGNAKGTAKRYHKCQAPGCTNPLSPLRSTRMYCSDACSQKAYRRRMRLPPPALAGHRRPLPKTVTIHHGDTLNILPTLHDLDACVVDPPYHLAAPGTARHNMQDKTWVAPNALQFQRLTAGFKQWDGGSLAFKPATWKLVYAALKPGAYLLALGGSRTNHRMVCAIEDAGFEIRDTIAWLYGQGFPKSKNLGKGRGTALKPAIELICVARKPLSESTVANNVLMHGTGGINIDACRADCGRWPANVLHDGSKAVEAAFNGTASRFFYTAKAGRQGRAGSKHPTVKPLALMRWLCRLVTPPGGTVLDCFAGSGTTGEAAYLEGFRAVLIEREAEYIADIHTRLYRHVGLVTRPYIIDRVHASCGPRR